MSDFVHLHVHSDYSLLDGCAKIERLMKYTAKCGMKSIALTDHGNMFGAIEFYEASKNEKAGVNVKPLIGCELYLVIDHKNTEKPQRGRVDAEGNETGTGSLQYKTYHMGVLAQDNTGYANLVKLVSDAHLNGMYYKPRTDIEKLAAHAQGLIGFSGCINGVIPRHILAGDEAGARKWLERMIEIFTKERFIIELQDHGYPEQKRINPILLKMAKDYGLTAVATNDSHYVEEGDNIAHDILLCIQTGSKLADADRMRFDVNEFYIKTPAQMERLFGDTPELITNTAKVAQMCNVSFNFKKNNYPAYRMNAEQAAAHKENYDLLKAICVAKLEKKYGVRYDPEGTDEYVKKISARLDYELAMIKKMGFVDYFLIVQEIVGWSVAQGIPISARGSAVGSMVSYICDIGNTDPIRFNLFFERFLNPERMSPPDIDLDICMRRRGEVIDYLTERYGKENVAHIITYGTFGAKSVIRDICRVKDVPFAEAARLANMVPGGNNPKTTHGWELKDVAELPEFANELKVNPLAQEIYKHGSIIEGMTRSTGKHAAGILITEKPLVEYLPLTLQEGAVTTQYDMGQVEKLGLLKMDLLGLKTLTIISDAVELVRKYANPNFTWEDKTGYDDQKAFDMISQGRTTGVFQLESGGMQQACKMVGVSNIDDINAIIALYRPGPMQFIPEYAKGKKDPSTVKYPHPLMEGVLKETYGIMVYQEQVMEAAKILAGYTLGGADILRRAMGKKKPEEMEKQRSVFVEGAQKTNNIPKEKALELFALIEKFASYGFNKSHSAAYAIVAYQTAYLKAHYPVEYMAAVLGCELGNAEAVAKFVAECKQMGVPVLGPDINESGLNFTPVGDKIRFGMGAIKGVGEGGAAKIIEERTNKGNFKNFADFVARVDSRALNKRVVEALVKAGAFDTCGDERAYLIENLETLMKGSSKKDANQGMLFDMFAMEAESAAEAKVEPLAWQTRLQYERELLGFYVTGHPLDEYRGLVEAIDTAEDITQLEDRENFRVCGVVSEVVKKFSKKDNQPWALFKLSTKSRTYEMQIFATAYAQHGSLMTEGALVVLSGQARKQNEELRWSIENVKLLEPSIASLIKKLSIKIKGDTECLKWLTALRDELLQNQGETEVELIIAPESTAGVVTQLPSSLKWRLNKKKYLEITGAPCVIEVKAKAVEYVPPKKSWENKGKAKAEVE